VPAGRFRSLWLRVQPTVFTLGLAEAVMTPAEGATKNEKHPVTFCYRDQKLTRASAQ